MTTTNTNMCIFYSAIDIEYPGAHGGSTHVAETVNALQELGHSVILACKHTKGQKFIEKKGSLKIYRIPIFFNSGILKMISVFKMSFWFYLLIFLTNRIDIVWARARIFGFAEAFWSSLFMKKMILEMNEPLIEAAEESGKFKNNFLFSLLKAFFLFNISKADLITVTHSSMTKNLPKNKSLLIDYGANYKVFNPLVSGTEQIIKKYNLKKGKTVLYSGSFREWHGLNSIIDSAEKVIAKDKEIKFLLLGNGPEFEKIEGKIKQKNLQENVFLLGKIPYGKMPSYVNASDICLALFSPEYPLFKKFSYFYSPLKVHEYKAMGKAVVATKLGNLEKLVVNGENGFSVENNDSQKVADSIMKLAGDSVLRKKISEQNIKEIKEHYNWVSITKNILMNLRDKECGLSK